MFCDVETIEELMARLPRLRRAYGWTQAEFASRLGVTQPTVSDWESGHKLPSRHNERLIRGVFTEAMQGRAA